MLFTGIGMLKRMHNRAESCEEQKGPEANSLSRSKNRAVFKGFPYQYQSS